MIKLTKSDFEKILAHAVKELPDEACGLIAGTVEGGDKEIKKVYLLTNIDHSNEHFSLDPKEQLEAIKDMRKNGFVPLGNWHSHPESPSRPSEEDKRLAFDSQGKLYDSFAYGQRKPRSQFIQNYGRYSGKGRACYRVKEGDYVRHRDYRQRSRRTFSRNLCTA